MFSAYAKKDVPSLLDKVSRLRHIGKGGSTKLNDQSIYTVKDLLKLLNTNPERLYKVTLQFAFILFQQFLSVYCALPYELLPIQCKNLIGR